jgi:hypothetical protein
MEIKKEQEEQIVNFGAFGYDALKIGNILGLTEIEIENEIKNENSELFKLLQKGRDMSDFVIDLKLFEMAKTGDIKALEKLDFRRKNREEATEKRLRERRSMERLKNNK